MTLAAKEYGVLQSVHPFKGHDMMQEHGRIKDEEEMVLDQKLRPQISAGENLTTI